MTLRGPGNALEAWAAAESRGRSPKRARPKAGPVQGWSFGDEGGVDRDVAPG